MKYIEVWALRDSERGIVGFQMPVKCPTSEGQVRNQGAAVLSPCRNSFFYLSNGKKLIACSFLSWSAVAMRALT